MQSSPPASGSLLPALLQGQAQFTAVDLNQARAFAAPFLKDALLPSGENALAHADALARLLQSLGGQQAFQAAAYVVVLWPCLQSPYESIAQALGEDFAVLAQASHGLASFSQPAQAHKAGQPKAQNENLRKMFLAFSRDLRVILLHLASCLQTLRYFAACRSDKGQGKVQGTPPVLSGGEEIIGLSLAKDALHVLAPLANRLGLWPLKWEMEDLAFRFLEPQTYKEIAQLLHEKRTERESYVASLCSRVEAVLALAGLTAKVQGRAKHIYSIVKKMRGKSLLFEQVLDLLALRAVLTSTADCYGALTVLHDHFVPVEGEFDDYIARPKANGYQSLHTVVQDREDDQVHGTVHSSSHPAHSIEIQIRSQAMHEHAEHGLAAHWVYKEAGTKGYSGALANSPYDQRIALLRQLLAWGQDMSSAVAASPETPEAGVPASPPTAVTGLFEENIYVLTPQAAVVELPQGATPVDFAYVVHTQLGHRCRGARINGQMQPLNTVLQNGQTVEIMASKEGGPSRDWLRADLGFLASPRARAKVRAWFNAQWQQETQAKGRELLEKLLQREGKTGVNLQELSAQLGYRHPDALFEVLGKEELSLKAVLACIQPALKHNAYANGLALGEVPGQEGLPMLPVGRAGHTGRAGHFGRTGGQAGGPEGQDLLVMGMDDLMSELAACCKPVPGDEIRGFVTRGKGVSVHRADCKNWQHLAQCSSERLIEVQWRSLGQALAGAGHGLAYPVEVLVNAAQRPGLLRDVSEVFSKEKVKAVTLQSTRPLQTGGEDTWALSFRMEVSSSLHLATVLKALAQVPGVHSVRRP